MPISPAAFAYELNFARCPIVMTGGIASSIPGGILPLLSISNAISFVGGLLTPGDNGLDANDFFAYFQPLAGGTLIDQSIGMYPFANQATAANAVIQNPLTISLLMICPAGAGGGYQNKSATIQSIQASFDQHNKSGGLYTIMTPSFPYTDCVMTAITDNSSSATKQVQNAYKIDFIKPLISLQAAAQAYNNLMGQIAGGVQTNGAQSGPASLVGSNVGATSPTVLPTPGQGGPFTIGPGIYGPTAWQ